MKFHGSAASALFFPTRWRSAPHQRQKLPFAVSARRNTVVEKQNAAPVLSLSKICSSRHGEAATAARHCIRKSSTYPGHAAMATAFLGWSLCISIISSLFSLYQNRIEIFWFSR